jgi:hypothetical protein
MMTTAMSRTVRAALAPCAALSLAALALALRPSAAEEETAMSPERPAAPIDRTPPEALQTATFALG